MWLSAEHKRTAQGTESAMIIARGRASPTRINTTPESSYDW